MNYEGLSVADGSQAGIVWSKFTDPATLQEEKGQLKRALLLYCQQDTLALARIIEALKHEASCPHHSSVMDCFRIRVTRDQSEVDRT